MLSDELIKTKDWFMSLNLFAQNDIVFLLSSVTGIQSWMVAARVHGSVSV